MPDTVNVCSPPRMNCALIVSPTVSAPSFAVFSSTTTSLSPSVSRLPVLALSPSTSRTLRRSFTATAKLFLSWIFAPS